MIDRGSAVDPAKAEQIGRYHGKRPEAAPSLIVLGSNQRYGCGAGLFLAVRPILNAGR
jgi:hypothetical protein